MSRISRLARYICRFIVDRRYRNEVVGIINRQVQGFDHEVIEPTSEMLADVTFLKGKRMFIAAGCDQTFMAEYLEKLGMDICITEALGRASDPMTELMLPGSRGLSETWDYYLLSVSQLLRNVFRRMQVDGMGYTREEQEEQLGIILDNYRQAILAIRGTSAAPILLFTYLMTYLPTYGLHEYRSMKARWSLIEVWHIFHSKLYQLAREFQGVYVFDADVATGEAGKARVVDATRSNGIYDHPSREGSKILGEHMVRHLSILEPTLRRVKCAVFDLDGTLWSGILREDGPAGVAVHEYFLNVMEQLAARGILLAICSKNDPVELDNLTGLLGTEVHARVVSHKLNWNPKSQSLREIAAELDIGLDSLAFFDDSPFERAEVAANASEVMVFSPEKIFGCINLPEFQQMGEITKESISRTEKYQQQAKRRQAQQASGTTLQDFLMSCEFRLDLCAPNASEISRISELLQRTNQLNATLARASLDELKGRFVDSARYVLRTARLRDRFGDYGLIGFASAYQDGPTWHILDLAFSCRSAGRGVEKAMLNHLAIVAQERYVTTMCIQFLCGPRNHQMFEILRDSGFCCEDSVTPIEGAGIRLDRPLGDATHAHFPNWLSVYYEQQVLTPCASTRHP